MTNKNRERAMAARQVYAIARPMRLSMLLMPCFEQWCTTDFASHYAYGHHQMRYHLNVLTKVGFICHQGIQAAVYRRSAYYRLNRPAIADFMQRFARIFKVALPSDPPSVSVPWNDALFQERLQILQNEECLHLLQQTVYAPVSFHVLFRGSDLTQGSVYSHLKALCDLHLMRAYRQKPSVYYVAQQENVEQFVLHLQAVLYPLFAKENDDL